MDADVAIVGLDLKIAPHTINANIAVTGVDVYVGLAWHVYFHFDALETEAKADPRSLMQLDLHPIAGLVSGDLDVVIDFPAARSDPHFHLLAGGDGDFDLAVVRVNHDVGFAGDGVIVTPFVGAG